LLFAFGCIGKRQKIEAVFIADGHHGAERRFDESRG